MARYRCLARLVDGDTIQDDWQSDMDADGYFVDLDAKQAEEGDEA